MSSQDPKNWKQNDKLNRRQFLRGITLAGAGLAAACAAGEVAREPTPYRTATPMQVLASPLAPAQSTPEDLPEGAISLEQFLELSSVLTGFDNLNPAVGQVFLQSLLAGEEGPSLEEIYTASGTGDGQVPQDVQTLVDAGFFEDDAVAGAADRIIEMWYTGIYSMDGEEHVATFVDSLAWKALHFTKPLTICGSFGFWANPPQVSISADIEYTPVPTPEEGEQQ